VKLQMAEGVRTVVYKAGEPRIYIRRGIYPTSMGLGDITKMHHKVNNEVLIVTDDAELDRSYSRSDADYSKSLAENIEYGYGNKHEWYNKPRRFIRDSKDKLGTNKYHVKAMKTGLTKRGLIVE